VLRPLEEDLRFESSDVVLGAIHGLKKLAADFRLKMGP
jgi:hypothetical protein